jgi:regulatory protein
MSVPKKKRPTRRPKAVDPEFLERVAVAYLERFDASATRLRQVLLRRARSALRLLEQEARPGEAQLEGWVEELLERYLSGGLLDDRRYAENLCRSLRGRGLSGRAIVERVRSKGVSAQVVEQALRELDRETGDPDHDPELNAAKRFARRRRLGPFRDPESRAERRQRDLALLLRAGFSYEIVRRVMDTRPE